jgi:putative restriction endonuclease
MFPHDGPDAEGNILCLCPNDHARFEYGALQVEDDLQIREAATGQTLGMLRTVVGHNVDIAQLAYHRERFDLTS